MLNDVQFLLLMVPAFLFSAWASWRVKVNFAAGQQVTARCGLTGAEAAERVLKQGGVIARIEETEGTLSDHYDPRDKVIRLSSAVYSGNRWRHWGWRRMKQGMPFRMALGRACCGCVTWQCHWPPSAATRAC